MDRTGVVGHVQHEITSHDAQADHADCVLLWWLIVIHNPSF
jgi:hypothetical protein